MSDSFWFGMGFAWGGLVLRLWALKTLVRAGLTETQILLVTRPPSYTKAGPYRWLTHPAYLGSLLFLAGIGIACLGPWGWVLALPAWPFFRGRMALEKVLREGPWR